MRNVLIAVDDTKGTRKAFRACSAVCRCMKPKQVTLVYVEKFEGRSLMTEMLGDAEMSTLEEVLKGTEYQTALDRKARTILSYYKNVLLASGISGVKTVTRRGHPAEEILKAAKKERSDMIVVGSRGTRTSRLFMGSVSREVVNHAEVPVLVVK